MTSRVTVAISFHDEERHLASAVRSVLNQSYRDFELLLIDDGSSDRSVEVARAFLVDPRVEVFSDGRRRHLGARLNEATQRARGELFVRMDADDVVHPDRLRLQLAHLERESTCEAVGTWAALIDEDEHAFGVIAPRGGPRTGRTILERGIIPHATMVARTAWLRAHPYDETLTRAEDRDLWCRVGLEARIDVLEDVLYVIRVLPTGAGFVADYLKGQADLRRVIRRHGPRLTGLPRTARMLSSSWLKSNIMRLAHACGASTTLVHRRGRRPTPTEVRRVEDALSSSRQAP
jgi:glycosyltransferase involved in cell wall biosynthesis